MRPGPYVRGFPAVLLVAGCCAAIVPAAGGEVPPARVLLVTGEDYPGHAWRETAPVFKDQLERDPRLQVDVLEDLRLLAGKDLAAYRAVILHFKNYDPAVPGRAGFDRLDAYVRGGGGLVLAHFACGAFQEYKDDFAHLAGRVWFGETPPPGGRQHDPHGPFPVRIADRDHPVTRGLRDFETTDELYTCLEGSAPIRVLADATSPVDGKTYPMAFVLQPGAGRVFHSVLGHDVQALQAEGPAALYRRGTAWAAGLPPPEP